MVAHLRHAHLRRRLPVAQCVDRGARCQAAWPAHLIKTNKDFISDFSIGLSHHLFGYFYSGYSAFISFILLGISDKMFGNINLIYAAILFAFPIGICFIPAYSAVFSKDVFLRYFEIFKKENEQWHRKWIYITIFFCIGSIIVFFSGIIIMSVIGH